MKITETPLAGVYILDLEPIEDERGFFAVTFSRQRFAEWGLNPCVEQCNLSYNHTVGTLRGMHYQEAPYAETKLVACRRGAIYDVVVDLRPDSSTYHQWTSVTLTAENRRMIYIPEGCAHGFQTLEPDTEVSYHVSAPYHPASARGVRWDDPAISIQWPLPVSVISPRDAAYAFLPS